MFRVEREMGSSLHKKRNVKRRVLTEQKLEEIGERLENLKNKVYITNPHTLDELKQNIRKEINVISEAELMRVNANFLRRCRRCIDAEGQHFQHLL